MRVKEVEKLALSHLAEVLAELLNNGCTIVATVPKVDYDGRGMGRIDGSYSVFYTGDYDHKWNKKS